MVAGRARQPRIPSKDVPSNLQWYRVQGLEFGARKGCKGLDRPALPGKCNVAIANYPVMKARTSRMFFLATLGAASLVAMSATAQTAAPATTPAPTPAATDPAPVKLPYGVEDVLKLSRAQVSEDVILNYVHNTGTIYTLSPDVIVYLRNQSVSDRVINTMLEQRQNVPVEMAAQSAPPSTSVAPQAPASPDSSAAAAAQASSQYAPAYAQAPPVYAEAQPTYVPASTVYVIPYSGGGYGYANSYPYYSGGYYGYCAPSVVVGVGYGRGSGYRGHSGGYHGGYHGGGHYGHSGHH